MTAGGRAGGAATPLVGRVVEAVVPERLGPSFRWIWTSSLASNLCDGILLAAAPLLIASLTSDPVAVALAVFLQRLPWLLFSLLAGAVVDRVDRRRLAVAVGLARAAVVAALALTIAADALSIDAVYVATFLLGTAETFADNTSSTLVADTVPRAGLGIANARLVGSLMVANNLVGPPVGAVLFGLGLVHPFTAYAVLMVAGALLVVPVRLPDVEARPARRPVVHEIAEGLRWLWHHPPVRTLAITIAAFNVTFGASIAVQVLYARERLGLGDAGFGFFLAASAVGGIVGSAAYGALEARFALGTLMRVCLTLECLIHLALALLRSPWLAGGVMFVFGAYAAVWGTTSNTVRQRAVPSRLLGRVGSVYLLGSLGGIAVGTLLGGLLADLGGVTAPLWFAFGGSTVLTAVLWRQFPLIAHAAEVGPQGA